MKVLLIGINSFIGSNIAKTLLQSGIDLYGTYRNQNENLRLLKEDLPELEIFQIDISRFDNFAILPTDFDLVFHTAAVSNGVGASNKEMIECNNLGSKNISIFCKNTSVSRIIYLSSMSIYGKIEEPIVDENTPIRNPDLYGQTKYHAEKTFEESEIPTVAIRLPGVLGVGASRAWLPSICAKLIKNEEIEIFNPNSTFNNVVSVDELASFIVSIAQQKCWSGFHAFPIAASNGIKVCDIVALAKLILNSKSNIKIGTSKGVMFNIDSTYAINQFNYAPGNTKSIIEKYLRLITPRT